MIYNTHYQSLFSDSKPPVITSSVAFFSDESFTFQVVAGSSSYSWSGTLEYTDGTKPWTVYSPSTRPVVTASSGMLYVRGSDITTFASGNGKAVANTFTFVGSNITCQGSVEALLDYATVDEGGHPTLGEYTFNRLFMNCTAIINTPEFTIETPSKGVYYMMFAGCTNLTECSAIHLTTSAVNCCLSMFNGCSSLAVLPALYPTNILANSYNNMFSGCSTLGINTGETGAFTIKYRIPWSGTGTAASGWDANMFYGTAGNQPQPEVNTTYYSNVPIIEVT